MGLPAVMFLEVQDESGQTCPLMVTARARQGHVVVAAYVFQESCRNIVVRCDLKAHEVGQGQYWHLKPILFVYSLEATYTQMFLLPRERWEFVVGAGPINLQARVCVDNCPTVYTPRMVDDPAEDRSRTRDTKVFSKW